MSAWTLGGRDHLDGSVHWAACPLDIGSKGSRGSRTLGCDEWPCGLEVAVLCASTPQDLSNLPVYTVCLANGTAMGGGVGKQ